METLRKNAENCRDPLQAAALGKMALMAEGTGCSGEIVNPQKPICMEVYPFSLENPEDGNTVFKKIQGILPYWKNLGVNAIWLAPIYPSPRKDMGYDIADYMAVDERFGTFDDFDNLVAFAHSMGQKVLMDLVLNHTSTEHEWFEKALSGDPKYRDYYYFTDTPQEDWSNFFDNQSAWEPVPDCAGKYYLHSFHEKQADLRWFRENGELNEKLLSEFERIIDFWTKKHHVDGFRLDVPQAIDKDFSNPERNIQTLMSGDGGQSSLVIDKLFMTRSHLLTTIETFDPTDDGSIMARYAGPGKPIQFAMNAFLAQQSESSMLDIFSESIRETPELMVAIQSHDTPRKDNTNETLIHLLAENPGAVCLYMGEEIGKKNPDINEFDNKAFFQSDAMADMQFKAAVRAKELENGGRISQSEMDEIASGIRENARANNRAPIAYDEYIAELEQQSANPGSVYNRLKNAVQSWSQEPTPVRDCEDIKR